jgi:hypothetical protein
MTVRYTSDVCHEIQVHNPRLYQGIYSRGYHCASSGGSKQDCPWQGDSEINSAFRAIWRAGFQGSVGENRAVRKDPA